MKVNLKTFNILASFLIIFVVLSSCSSGSGGGSADGGCDGSCANQQLLAEDVTIILGRVVESSQKKDVSVTASVLDRVGNVLAVMQMPGARSTTVINGKKGASGGLEGAVVPATLASISKAGTGAYLSSQGNAFSTRTASQIIQENFYPLERNQPGGPLFGVQFSQLPCSDIMKGAVKPLPLGLSADPGGLPLYKNGDLVGGIGIELDGEYSLDTNISDIDAVNIEEEIAAESSSEFRAPQGRTADNVYAGGKALRFSDAEYISSVGTLPVFDSTLLVKIPGFFSGTIKSGVIFGTPESGILKSTRAGAPSEVIASIGEGTKSSSLSASEVSAILDSALLTAERSRAAIRTPLDTRARVSIFIVDTNGAILGATRSQDAPVFGIDVALQKARTAAFFSGKNVAQKLGGFSHYINSANSFFGIDVFNGSFAFTTRAIGNLSRPFYPDGINSNANGPLSLPIPGNGTPSFSPFNTGLQLDIIFSSLLAPLSGNIPATCTSIGQALGNGIQIFPGSAPLYKDGALVGAIGVSGDGVDQDDLISYFGASREGLNFAGYTSIGDSVLGFNAPKNIRSDTLIPTETDARLRFINCPEGAFIEDNSQNVCE